MSYSVLAAKKKPSERGLLSDIGCFCLTRRRKVHREPVDMCRVVSKIFQLQTRGDLMWIIFLKRPKLRHWLTYRG